MAENRFDSLSRRLPTSSTRRRLWKAVGGGLLGYAFVRVGLDRAQAATRCLGKKTGQPCSGRNFCWGGDICRHANAQHLYGETVKRLCRPLGYPCQKHIDCCGIDVLCNDGYCISA